MTFEEFKSGKKITEEDIKILKENRTSYPYLNRNETKKGGVTTYIIKGQMPDTTYDSKESEDLNV